MKVNKQILMKFGNYLIWRQESIQKPKVYSGLESKNKKGMTIIGKTCDKKSLNLQTLMYIYNSFMGSQDRESYLIVAAANMHCVWQLRLAF